MEDLNSSERIKFLRQTISTKTSLRMLYEESYGRYMRCISSCKGEGSILEMGSGGGFADEIIPSIITSDVIKYPGVDVVFDGTAFPFSDKSLKAICMLNVLHHIPDVEAFFGEVDRTLSSGGKLIILDQHNGIISRPILRLIHHERFSPNTQSWKFATGSPLSEANGALAWIVFVRDRKKFEKFFPRLKIQRYITHTPLRYWLSGGLRSFSLLPGWGFPVATIIDEMLVKLCPDLGSFVEIELEKA